MGPSYAPYGVEETSPGHGESVNDSDSNPCSFARTGMLGCSLVEADKAPLFDALPVEITILIFQHAAQMSKNVAASLSLVSRLARQVVLPQLFRTIVLQNRNSAHKLSEFLNKNRHIASYVRELWMKQSTASDVRLILPCRRLERLAFTPSCFNALFDTDATVPSTFAEDADHQRSPPYELRLFPGFIKWNDITPVPAGAGDNAREFLQCLTHLSLCQESQLVALLNCKEAIIGLQQLTNLASPVGEVILLGLTVRDVLNAFPKLHMFVMTPSSLYDPWMDYHRWTAGIDYRLLGSIRSIAFGRDTKDVDERLYYVDSCGRTREQLFFDSWKGPESGIWACARPISSLSCPSVEPLLRR